ncbi:MAG: hypothetical protein A2073_07915 [Deltaproteobacteria bacterium GWC2_42_11]|nr:MAG: hypothetical protein A2073_07915 [Deltaproteobacteria bacterium GWC2_42_11]
MPLCEPMVRVGFTITFLLFFFSADAYAYDVTRSPDFWISRLDNPDAVLMDDFRIKMFNEEIIASIDQMADVSRMGETIAGDIIKGYILEDPLPKDKAMFDRNGRKVREAFYRQVEKNFNLDGVGNEVRVRFGVMVKRADIRAFPTLDPLFKSAGSKGFDAVQYSSIYPPEVVALLHISKDREWGFFQTGFVRGWIRLDSVAFAEGRGMIDPYGAEGKEFLIVTGSFVNIYKDRELKKVIERLPMGARLSISGEYKDRWGVAFPHRVKDGLLKWGSAYISKKSDVSIRFLPYSKKNIIRQAFKVLDEEYGWGGINRKRDCSLFIRDVFATVGVNIPRNSRQQAVVGSVLVNTGSSGSAEEIKSVIGSSAPGITLLAMDGHIMLYLGNIEERHYVIHSVYRYEDVEGIKVVNKTTVTDLNTGSGTKNGAIMDRIKGVTLLIPNGYISEASRP